MFQAEAGASLGALADAADAVAAGDAEARDAGVLLSAEAKAAGVPCSPAQAFFVAAHLVRCPEGGWVVWQLRLDALSRFPPGSESSVVTSLP